MGFNRTGLVANDLAFIDSKRFGIASGSDMSSQLSSAIDAAIVAGVPLRIRNPGGAITISTVIPEKTLSASQSLAIQCDAGVTFDVGNLAQSWLSVKASSIGTVQLSSTAVAGASRATLSDASSVQAGDILAMNHSILIETGWHYSAYEVWRVGAKSSNTVLLSDPILFPFDAQATMTWTAVGSASESFWYPSYFTPSASIEVLVDDVVTAPTSFTARTDDSDHFGWDVVLATTVGQTIKIRRKSANANAITVYRGGRFSWSGGRIIANAANIGGMSLTGLYEPTVTDVEFTRSTKADGTQLAWFACYRPKTYRVKNTGGYYPLIVHSGTKRPIFEDIEGYATHHVIATGMFVDGLQARRITGAGNDQIFDTHPSFNTLLEDLSSDDAPNTRGVGATWRRVAVRTTDTVNSIGPFAIFWLQNSAINSPMNVMAGRFDTVLEDVSCFTADGSARLNLNIGGCRNATLTRVTAGTLQGYNSSTIEPFKSITMNDCDFLDTNIRYADNWTINGGRFKALGFSGASTAVWTVTLNNVRFSNSGGNFFHDDNGDSSLRTIRTINGCLFESSAGINTKDNTLGHASSITNTASIRYRFNDCIIAGISGFGTLAATTDESVMFTRCVYRGAVTPQSSQTGQTGSNGQRTYFRQATTISSALSGASYTASNIIPAGSLVLGVSVRVTTAITGATTFQVGYAGDPDAWGATVAIASGTTTTPANFTITGPIFFATATSVVATANGSNFAGGVLRTTVHYIEIGAATS